MNKKISDMFDGFQLEPEVTSAVTFDPEKIRKATMARIHRSNTALAARRRIWRTALIAAVIASFLSVTAYAAVVFSMHYRYRQEGETPRYRITLVEPDGSVIKTFTAQPMATLTVRFDTMPESTFYAFRADWLPSDPSYVNTLYNMAWDMARNRLHMPGLPATEEEKQAVDRETAEVLTEMGVTEAEAKTWYTGYDSNTTYTPDTPEGPTPPKNVPLDIPYQIDLSNSSDLYKLDCLVGGDGGQVELLREETEGDWQTLWLRVSQGDEHHTEDYVNPLCPYGIVLRFNTAEGYLIRVAGTLDCETLHKIAENIQVLRTELETVADREEQGYSFMDLSQG